jgi:hypothetical protein
MKSNKHQTPKLNYIYIERICLASVLRNMTSMEEMKEKLQTLCIDQTKILQYEKSLIQMTIANPIYRLPK